MSSILRVQELTKRYDNHTDGKAILDNLSLDIEEREFLCILGPSGCGKTTFLRCIAGFEKYTGNIYVNDKLVNNPSNDRIMVFQDFNQLFPWKTVIGNIRLPLKLQGIKDKKIQDEIASEALQKVNLTGYENYYPYQLSGGMKQRVAIAKALALKPQIVLMDEPFAALDAMTRRNLQDELIKIAEKETCTFIFVTHNIQEALILGKRIIVFTQGGEIVIDEENTIPKPVTPASNGYGEAWQKIREALG